jgi:maltose-binding protein MalE
LAGWVQADCAYVNSNTEEKNLFATLSFIGYLLDPNVQMRLAEVGHIPSVETTQPRDPLIRQAMNAFENGSPYPNIFDNSVLDLYWDELDQAVLNVFQNGIDPADALREATNNIKLRLRETQKEP